MTITVTAVKAVGKNNKAGQNEDKASRITRMKRYWDEKQNAVLYNLGQLLATKAGDTTLAEQVVAGEELVIDRLTMPNGTVLVLDPVLKISLKNVPRWGCPACHSAHGSGVYPSRDITVKGLKRNSWFYNPATKQAFVISDSCWDDYVKAFGAATQARFIDVPGPGETMPPKSQDDQSDPSGRQAWHARLDTILDAGDPNATAAVQYLLNCFEASLPTPEKPPA
jgi:hypothetical protein